MKVSSCIGCNWTTTTRVLLDRGFKSSLCFLFAFFCSFCCSCALTSRISEYHLPPAVETTPTVLTASSSQSSIKLFLPESKSSFPPSASNEDASGTPTSSLQTERHVWVQSSSTSQDKRSYTDTVEGKDDKLNSLQMESIVSFKTQEKKEQEEVERTTRTRPKKKSSRTKSPSEQFKFITRNISLNKTGNLTCAKNCATNCATNKGSKRMKKRTKIDLENVNTECEKLHEGIKRRAQGVTEEYYQNTDKSGSNRNSRQENNSDIKEESNSQTKERKTDMKDLTTRQVSNVEHPSSSSSQQERTSQTEKMSVSKRNAITRSLGLFFATFDRNNNHNHRLRHKRGTERTKETEDKESPGNQRQRKTDKNHHHDCNHHPFLREDDDDDAFYSFLSSRPTTKRQEKSTVSSSHINRGRIRTRTTRRKTRDVSTAFKATSFTSVSSGDKLGSHSILKLDPNPHSRSRHKRDGEFISFS